MNGEPPASVIRDGDLKASIWENEGRNGTYFTTTFAKTYRDSNDKPRDTSVFNNSDLLRVSELARQAYGKTNELRQEMLNTQRQDHSIKDITQEAAEWEKQHSNSLSNVHAQDNTTDV
ncbi:hypothetical protein ABVF61_19075 [Roseibium sp. HPY-6]|uniref:hypothetical protein n=1 Tax=Roseibium sp. HPY-6 TaxID=3229852 RepID=UPI00339044DB